jgi:hypothetical protein
MGHLMRLLEGIEQISRRCETGQNFTCMTGDEVRQVLKCVTSCLQIPSCPVAFSNVHNMSPLLGNDRDNDFTRVFSRAQHKPSLVGRSGLVPLVALQVVKYCMQAQPCCPPRVYQTPPIGLQTFRILGGVCTTSKLLVIPVSQTVIMRRT